MFVFGLILHSDSYFHDVQNLLKSVISVSFFHDFGVPQHLFSEAINDPNTSFGANQLQTPTHVVGNMNWPQRVFLEPMNDLNTFWSQSMTPTCVSGGNIKDPNTCFGRLGRS